MDFYVKLGLYIVGDYHLFSSNYEFKSMFNQLDKYPHNLFLYPNENINDKTYPYEYTSRLDSDNIVNIPMDSTSSESTTSLVSSPHISLAAVPDSDKLEIEVKHVYHLVSIVYNLHQKYLNDIKLYQIKVNKYNDYLRKT